MGNRSTCGLACLGDNQVEEEKKSRFAPREWNRPSPREWNKP